MASDAPRFEDAPAMVWTQEGTEWLIFNDADQRQRWDMDIQNAVARGDLERLAWIMDAPIPLNHWRLMDIWKACLTAGPGPVAAWVVAQVGAMPDQQRVVYGKGEQRCCPRAIYAGEMANALGATDRHDLLDEVAALGSRQPLEQRIGIWIQWLQGAASALRPAWVTPMMASLSSGQRQALYERMIERWEVHGEALSFLWAHDPKASLEEQSHWLTHLFNSEAFCAQTPPSSDGFMDLLRLWAGGGQSSSKKTTWLTQVLAWKHPPVAVVVHLLDDLPSSEVVHLEHATAHGAHPVFQEAQAQRRARERQAQLCQQPIGPSTSTRPRA